MPLRQVGVLRKGEINHICALQIFVCLDYTDADIVCTCHHVCISSSVGKRKKDPSLGFEPRSPAPRRGTGNPARHLACYHYTNSGCSENGEIKTVFVRSKVLFC